MRREDFLDLNDVLQHPGRKIAVDISTEFEEDADIDLMTPLEGYLEAVSTGNLLLITGSFSAQAMVECARCGSPIEIPIAFEVEEQFPVEGAPSSFNAQDYARVVPDEPYELFEGNNLIVQNLLRQDLLVAMPMQALCQYGWEGDCPISLARGELPSASKGRQEFRQLANLLTPEEEER